jgi:RNase adaptor protein for sRNA GlmZ degradation
MMHIDLYSFGYHFSGIPRDPGGHGGGFVFDCRALPNPGREVRFAMLSGLDPEVQEYIRKQDDTAPFLFHALALVERAARSYEGRGYTRLQVCFGCTGGQHRSVYCTERAAEALRDMGFEVTITHTERERWA